MSMLAALAMACASAISLASAVEYTYVGPGYCADAQKQPYEEWTATSVIPSLTYQTDSSTCACPECERVCSSYDSCVGYEFYCCPYGERCINAGSVLFSQGTRPEESPPRPFSTEAYMGSATSG